MYAYRSATRGCTLLTWTYPTIYSEMRGKVRYLTMLGYDHLGQKQDSFDCGTAPSVDAVSQFLVPLGRDRQLSCLSFNRMFRVRAAQLHHRSFWTVCMRHLFGFVGQMDCRCQVKLI
jgi:hypothetical protein